MPHSHEEEDEEDVDGMDGYGYFDMGSMAKLLATSQHTHSPEPENEEVAERARKRAAIGKRLRLAEY